MSSLQLRGVEKVFGDTRVIQGVDLTIAQGEFVVFVGPSGRGKSTLLRIIAGLTAIDGGSLHLDGRDMALLERSRNGIEFFGLSDRAVRHFHAVKSARGFERLAAFFLCLSDLAHCTDYRLLSSVRIQGEEDAISNGQVSDIVSRVTRDYALALLPAALASELGMSDSRFSRFFGEPPETPSRIS